jgi:hypothetical protein
MPDDIEADNQLDDDDDGISNELDDEQQELMDVSMMLINVVNCSNT